MYISSSGLEIFAWVFASSKLKSLKQHHGRQHRILCNFWVHNHWMIQVHCDSFSSYFLAAGITFDVLCDVKGLSCKLSMCSMTLMSILSSCVSNMFSRLVKWLWKSIANMVAVGSSIIMHTLIVAATLWACNSHKVITTLIIMLHHQSGYQYNPALVIQIL